MCRTSMVMGVVQALERHGYNKESKLNSIPVVGLDGVSEAKELVSKGFMLGTASQDTAGIADAIYTVGMNLVYGRNPVEDIPYKLDETGVEWQFLFHIKHIPYQCFDKS